jgi:hypothetical protein
MDPHRLLPTGAAVTEISRTAYNDLLRMLLRWREDQSRPSRSARTPQRDVSTILVQNDSGYDAPAFGILGLGDPLVDPDDEPYHFRRQPCFSGELPTVADHTGKWVPLLEPIDYDGSAKSIGRAVLLGLAVVRVYVTATTDTHVEVTSAKTVGSETVYLATGQIGTQLLWLESVSAGQIGYALVRMGTEAPPLLWGKLDAALDYDETSGVAVSVWSDDWSSDTGINLSGVLPPPTMTTGTIASGSWVRVVQRADGVWYVDMAPC